MATPPNAPVIASAKPRILVDFDGVIHDYDPRKWPAIGEPVAGAFEWLESLIPHFDIWIFTSRCLQVGSVLQLKRWFRLWWPNSLRDIDIGGGELVFNFTAEKLPAKLAIDDRALRFTGSFPAVADLLDYQTWQQGTTLSERDVELYEDDLRTWSGHLAASQRSFLELAAKDCFGDPWRARFRYIADQIGEAASSIIESLPPA